jgi:hypothetical protein
VCDPSSPHAPTDCAFTGQFTCDDWTLLCGCRCNVEAGVDSMACCGDAGMVTGNGCYNLSTSQTWSCQSYDPPVGCDCRQIVVAIL